MFRGHALLACATGISLGSLLATPPPQAGSARPDQVVADEVYLQETGRQWPTSTRGVGSVAAREGKAWLLVDGVLHTAEEGRLTRVATGSVGNARLSVVQGNLLAVGPEGLHPGRDPLLLGGIENQRVQVAIARVEHVGHGQVVAAAQLLDGTKHPGQGPTGHHPVLHVVGGGDAPHGGEG